MKSRWLRKKSEKGFTIIELVVSLAVFAILAAGVLGAFAALNKSVRAAREKTVLSSLAASYLERVRNLPYSHVGTVSGNPSGQLPDYDNAIQEKIEAFTYKIFYEVTFVDDPADGVIGGIPNDSAPADYKQVKMSIQNMQTGQVTNFVTNVVPKGLEGLQNAGALRVRVFNKVGQPIEGAQIHIQHPTSSPALILDRVSDVDGEWIEVGLLPDVNNYRIVVTKQGYTTDQTYPITVQNPNPLKPDATIEVGVVTEVSFFIDLWSNLTIRTLDNLCHDLDGVDLNVRGAKFIGITPDVYKFDQDFTSSAGQVLLSDIEWDTYTPTLLTGQSWVVLGTSPIQKIDVSPGTSQTFTMILGVNTMANSLLIIVKDAATGASLEGAQVHLRKGGSVPQDYYGISGGSVWMQDDWTGGAGLADWSATNPDRYFQDNGNIDTNSAPTGVRLKKINGDYVGSGWVESSTFDTGSDNSNFTTIAWSPSSQTASAVLQFQLASSSDLAGPWNYVGPDGTDETFYEFSGSNISTVHDSSRYIRYKAFFDTSDTKDTPVLTSLQINYVSGCFTPGQFWIGDLTAGNNYDLDVSLTGYTTQVLNSLNINGNQSIEVLLSP